MSVSTASSVQKAGLVFACWAVAAAAVAQTPLQPVSLRQEPSAAFRDTELIWCFQGKGSSLFYDAGITTAAYRRIDALQRNRVVVTGNSSGSIWVAYFAGAGFTDEAVEKLRKLSARVDVSTIRRNEDVATKVSRVLASQATEMPHSVVKEAIAVALGVDEWQDCRDIDDVVRRSRWVPRYPFVIVAANLDVIGGSAIDGLTRKRLFDSGDYSVRWSDEAYAAYRRDPAHFEKENPLLTLAETPHIGKACTYFCDEATHDLLAKLPYEQRLGDLRVVRDAADVAIAIQASMAEPTYFPPVIEPALAKLTIGDRPGGKGTCRSRLYCGGFIMPVVAQDLRRMLPETRVVGTGWIGLPLLARKYFEHGYGIDVQELHHRGNWWLDVELQPPQAMQRQIIGRRLNPEAEFTMAEGFAAAECAGSGKSPQYTREPRFVGRGRHAIARDGDAGTDTVASHEAEPLPTLRGFGNLVDAAVAVQK